MTNMPDDQPTTAAPAATDMIGSYVGKARAFAKAKPAATAALAGVLGLAILNTLRGRR